MTLTCRIHAAHDLRLEQLDTPAPHPHDVRLRLAAAGICGSDLHHWQHGRVGAFEVREPPIPGHEASGVVQASGGAVTRVQRGDRVAINPSQPLRPLRLLPQRSRQPVPDDVLPGQRQRVPARPGPVPRRLGNRRSAAHARHRNGHRPGRGRLRRAAVDRPACAAPRRPSAAGAWTCGRSSARSCRRPRPQTPSRWPPTRPAAPRCSRSLPEPGPLP